MINQKDLHNTIINSVNKALRHDHPEMSPNRSELEYFKAGIRWMAKGVAMEARKLIQPEKPPNLFPCGDFYDVASDQRECANMLSKPCAGCMFNQERKASQEST